MPVAGNAESLPIGLRRLVVRPRVIVRQVAKSQQTLAVMRLRSRRLKQLARQKIIHRGDAARGWPAPTRTLHAGKAKHRQKVAQRIDADFPIVEQVELCRPQGINHLAMPPDSGTYTIVSTNASRNFATAPAAQTTSVSNRAGEKRLTPPPCRAKKSLHFPSAQRTQLAALKKGTFYFFGEM